MLLERHLPMGCTYLPCDVARRDARTTVVDLNQSAIPADVMANADLVTMLGVWEYLHDPERMMAQLKAANLPVVCSYCTVELMRPLDRRAMGWVNDFTVEDFVVLAGRSGLQIQWLSQVDPFQYLFKLVPASMLDVSSRPPRVP